MLDDIARFNETTPDIHIENIAQEVAARWIVHWAGRTVLDLGYGAGIVTRALLDARKHVLCVEGSPHVFAKIDKRAMAVLNRFEDFDPTPDDRFDTVVASHVLEHVADPRALLAKLRPCADRIIVLVPNAQSLHRRLAVAMGLQPTPETLSERDKIEGHVRVYTLAQLREDLIYTGWSPIMARGFMVKTLPNSMMLGHSEALLRAMCEVELPAEFCANLGVVAE